MDKPLAVTGKTFEREVLKADTPVLADFWAEWCHPCLMIAPVLEEIALEYDGRLKVVKIDVDASSNLASRYGVRGIPTLILFKEGQPMERILGYMPKAELVAKIEPYLVPPGP